MTTETRRKISLDEISLSRSSSTGSHVNMIPPIHENSPLEPLTPEIGKVESSGFEGGASLPKRSASSSMVEAPERRFSSCKRTSRVMVMLSVARVNYSQDNNQVCTNES